MDGWIPIALWLGLGAVVALYLYRRMDMEGKVVRAWLIAGLLLSVLGLILFLAFRSMKEKGRDKAVDPKSLQAAGVQDEGGGGSAQGREAGGGAEA